MTHHERLIATRADLGRLNSDELEAVAYLVAKLLAGSAKHGPLALASDHRDWPSEMMEEYADALFYAAFASVQRQRRTAPPSMREDLLALAAREATVEHRDAPAVTSDAYWQRHPLGSPERVQAVEEHRAAVEAGK
jgi:hypothetical protein